MPPVPRIAHRGMIYRHDPCLAGTTAKRVAAGGHLIAINHDGLARTPAAILGKFAPQLLAPHDDALRAILVYKLIEGGGRRSILLVGAGLARAIHSHLQVITEHQRLPNLPALGPIRLVAHQAALKLEVGAHPRLARRAAFVKICGHCMIRESGTLRMIRQVATVGTAFAAVVALAKHHDALAKNATIGIVLAHKGLKKNTHDS